MKKNPIIIIHYIFCPCRTRRRRYVDAHRPTKAERSSHDGTRPAHPRQPNLQSRRIALKDAVVHFGGGCTGEVISAEAWY